MDEKQFLKTCDDKSKISGGLTEEKLKLGEIIGKKRNDIWKYFIKNRRIM